MAPPSDRLAIGRLALHAGALREALLHFRAAALQTPEQAEAHHAHAETAALLGEFEEAVAARRRALALAVSPRGFWQLGVLADYAGDRVLAIESLEASLADLSWATPDLGGSHPAEYLFRIHIEMGDLDAARAFAERRGWLHDGADYCAASLDGVSLETQGLLAVLVAPETAVCGPAIAAAFADSGNVNLARFVARRVASAAAEELRDPAAALLRRRLPEHDVAPLVESLNGAAYNLHHVLRQPAEAIRVYQRAIALDPAFSWPYRNIGVVYLELQEYADAVHWLEQAVALSPEHSRNHAALAAAAYEQDRFEEALAAYQRAAQLDPAIADYHSGIGTCLIRLGRRREALDPLRAASRIDPADDARRRFYEYHAEVEALEQA